MKAPFSILLKYIPYEYDAVGAEITSRWTGETEYGDDRLPKFIDDIVRRLARRINFIWRSIIFWAWYGPI